MKQPAPRDLVFHSVSIGLERAGAQCHSLPDIRLVLLFYQNLKYPALLGFLSCATATVFVKNDEQN